jgi:acyl carrier protein
MAPKLQGLDVLVRLLGGESLDVVALMSSINAVLGAAGACDYAAANLVLDRFAESASWPTGWRRVVAIDWGAWRDVGMAAKLEVAPAMRAQWQAHLARAIAPAQGVQAFARALASGRRRVVIVSYDLVRAHEIARLGVPPTSRDETQREPHSAARAKDTARVGAVARPVGSGSGTAPRSDVEQQLSDIWTELLGVEAVGVDDDFFELGGHSLLATRVLARVGEAFGVRLALRDVFEAPTVARLAQRIASAGASTAPPAATRPALHDDGEREEVEF